jgi:hypothetical protein
MTKIVVQREDGGVSIIIPANEVFPELLERDALAVEGYVSHRIIDDSKIPQDRVFRDAWTDEYNTTTIDIHASKAKEIALTKLRNARQKKFEALGFPIRLSPEIEAAILSEETKTQLKELRDVTEPLKSLSATGKATAAKIETFKQMMNILDE